MKMWQIAQNFIYIFFQEITGLYIFNKLWKRDIRILFRDTEEAKKVTEIKIVQKCLPL